MTLPVKLCVAPMAGVADRAYRELAMQYGASMCFTEMISIKGLYYNDKKTAELLDNSTLEHPLAIQLFGHEPEIFEQVIEKALSFGGDYIDINSNIPLGHHLRISVSILRPGQFTTQLVQTKAVVDTLHQNTANLGLTI